LPCINKLVPRFYAWFHTTRDGARTVGTYSNQRVEEDEIWYGWVWDELSGIRDSSPEDESEENGPGVVGDRCGRGFMVALVLPVAIALKPRRRRSLRA